MDGGGKRFSFQEQEFPLHRLGTFWKSVGCLRQRSEAIEKPWAFAGKSFAIFSPFPSRRSRRKNKEVRRKEAQVRRQLPHRMRLLSPYSFLLPYRMVTSEK